MSERMSFICDHSHPEAVEISCYGLLELIDMLFMFQQIGEETITRRVRHLLATDLAAGDEGVYGNSRTLLYAPTMSLTVGQKRY
jgi:hypothetical protein